MAFSSTTVHMGEVLFPPANPNLVSVIAAAIATNAASFSAIGGASAIAYGCIGFLQAYRQKSGDPQASGRLSADKTVSVAVSTTTTLVTVQFQL